MLHLSHWRVFALCTRPLLHSCRSKAKQCNTKQLAFHAESIFCNLHIFAYRWPKCNICEQFKKKESLPLKLQPKRCPLQTKISLAEQSCNLFNLTEWTILASQIWTRSVFVICIYDPSALYQKLKYLLWERYQIVS